MLFLLFIVTGNLHCSLLLNLLDTKHGQILKRHEACIGTVC